MRISIIGAGYVGLSNAVLLSTKHDVICYDIDKTKVDLINDKKSPIKDKLISQYLRTKKLSLKLVFSAFSWLNSASMPYKFSLFSVNFNAVLVKSAAYKFL